MKIALNDLSKSSRSYGENLEERHNDLYHHQPLTLEVYRQPRRHTSIAKLALLLRNGSHACEPPSPQHVRGYSLTSVSLSPSLYSTPNHTTAVTMASIIPDPALFLPLRGTHSAVRYPIQTKD